MTDDRQLLEAAARAAGLTIHHWSRILPGPMVGEQDPERYWNPLTNDGDAFRLAVKLRLLVDFSSCCAMSLKCADDDWFGGDPMDDRVGLSPDECDPNAATRRAIVRAAAAIAQQAGKETE